MALTHNLGFPRIGARRELEQALEAYWRGDINEERLQTTAAITALERMVEASRLLRVRPDISQTETLSA